MRKLKLSLDTLEVTSFDTDSGSRGAAGTVHARSGGPVLTDPAVGCQVFTGPRCQPYTEPGCGPTEDLTCDC